MVIRPIVTADHPALEAEVNRARLAGEFQGSSDPEAKFFMRSFELAPSPVSAAFGGDDGILGFISPEFKVVVVRPQDRRHGIGRSLVEAGLAIERDRARPNLLIGVLPGDNGSHEFLRATGFTFHSTLWDLELPEAMPVTAPNWPAGHVARPYDRTRDARPWATLFNAAFADHPTPLQIADDAVDSAADDPTIEDADTILLEDSDGGALIGFCATTPERIDGAVGPAAEIWTIGVRPDRQGRGLGRQLLRWGVRRLREIGARHVFLSVNGRNEGALGLYLSEGFVRSRTRDRWARPVEAGVESEIR
ncbi:MAG TPA: GNAT family N-acetyltransferase [Candidatus Limnocylindrales bacterium]|nr:GNAT family N-acetyltransferase [Candidatus Limnocylindrales bacterium]